MEPSLTPDPVLTPSVITPLEKLQTDIALAKETDAKVKFDYRDPKQNKLARSHINDLRGINGDIGRAHKTAKAGVIELGNRIDAKKDELLAEVAALILPHQTAVDAIKKEEDDRKARHLSKAILIGGFRPTIEMDLAELRTGLANLQAIDTTDMEEYATEAEGQRVSRLVAFHAAVREAEKREQEAAELATLRAEAAASAEKARVERIQREAVEAERKRTEDAERSRLVREAEERARFEAVAQAERVRLAREAQDKLDAEAKRTRDAEIEKERALAREAEAARKLAEAEAQALRDQEAARVRAEEDAKRAAQAEIDRKAEAKRHREEVEALKREEAERAAREADAATARENARIQAEKMNRLAVIDAIAVVVQQIMHDGDKGPSCVTALEIAQALASGQIPHVRIDWEAP